MKLSSKALFKVLQREDSRPLGENRSSEDSDTSVDGDIKETLQVRISANHVWVSCRQEAETTEFMETTDRKRCADAVGADDMVNDENVPQEGAKKCRRDRKS